MTKYYYDIDYDIEYVDMLGASVILPGTCGRSKKAVETYLFDPKLNRKWQERASTETWVKMRSQPTRIGRMSLRKKEQQQHNG